MSPSCLMVLLVASLFTSYGTPSQPKLSLAIPYPIKMTKIRIIGFYNHSLTIHLIFFFVPAFYDFQVSYDAATKTCISPTLEKFNECQGNFISFDKFDWIKCNLICSDKFNECKANFICRPPNFYALFVIFCISFKFGKPILIYGVRWSYYAFFQIRWKKNFMKLQTIFLCISQDLDFFQVVNDITWMSKVSFFSFFFSTWYKFQFFFFWWEK